MKTRIQKRNPQDHKIVLYDGFQEGFHRKKGAKTGTVSVKVQLRPNGIFLMPKGYGDCSSVDGHGTPVMIEFYHGELRVVVWQDINKEDPTHIISLGTAREIFREVGVMGTKSKVKRNYPNGKCPDCKKEIPEDVEEGQECSNCGHVFCKEKENDQ